MSSSYMAWASARNLLLYVGHRGAGRDEIGEQPLHAVDGPEEIDGGGPGSGESSANLFELGREVLRGRGVAAQSAEGDAVSGRDADGGSAADDHGDDDVGHLFIGGGEHVALFERELGLVDEADAVGGPVRVGIMLSSV